MDWIIALLLLWHSIHGAASGHDITIASLKNAQAAADSAAEYAKEAKQEASLYKGNPEASKILHTPWVVFPNITYPGDVVMIRSDHAGTVKWQQVTYHLLPFETGYYAYIPISLYTRPGTYAIGKASLTVKSKSFKTDRITVSKQKASMTTNYKRIDADQVRIDKARSKTSPTFLGTGSFVLPVKGPVTTPYGYKRIVNGKLDGYHYAIDIAAKKGTPVRAMNAGKVVLADHLYLTGNTVYIDHGMNLFSQYCHMSKLLVKTGDTVKKGQIIGLIGTTGFSTGPHLHFTFWVGNKPVNPNLFLGTTPFDWHDPVSK